MKPSLGSLLLTLSLAVPSLQETSGCESTPTPTPLPTPTPTPAPPVIRPETTLGQLSALRLDAHTHPYKRDANNQLVYDGGLNLNAVVTSNNLGAVLSSVRMDTYSEVDNGEAMRTVANTYPYVVPLLWIHPGHGGSADTAEIYVRDHQFAGLKFHPAREDLPADSPLVDPYLDVCARYGVPMVIHTASDDPSWPERVGNLAFRHPDARIILYHAGLSTDHLAATQVVESYPNTWLESSWVKNADLLTAINTLGSERVLWGTDATTDGAVHYENNWGSGVGGGSYDADLISLGTSLPRDQYRNLLVQNTTRVFRLVTLHTHRPGASAVSVRFDNGTGSLGDPWPMQKESGSWWRRVVPSPGPVRFQVLVDGVDVDGTLAETDAWEVWQKDGALQSSVPTTTLQFKYDAGFGHSLFVRGEGWPLSWSTGEPATWTTGNVWTLTLAGVVEPLSYKVLIDDLTWETGANHTINPGQTLQVTPTF